MNAKNSQGNIQKHTELGLCLMNPKILYYRVAIYFFTLKAENASFFDPKMLLCFILTAQSRLNQPIEKPTFKVIMIPMITCSGCCLRVRV